MRSRPGFTLIELMVAMALTLFIMVILSQAFILSLDTFSALKGVGDMQASLRSAMTALRSDLAAPHFEGARRLSEGLTLASNPPVEGFFFIRQSSPPGGPFYVAEGTDADGEPSFRAVDHILHFSVKLQGNGQESFFTTPINFRLPLNLNPNGPANTFYNKCKLFDFMTPDQAQDATLNPLVYDTARGKITPPFMFRSQWAEVAYFLVQTGSSVELNNPLSTQGTPVFALYRAQLVTTPYVTDLNSHQTTTFWVNQSKGAPILTQPFFGLSVGIRPTTSPGVPPPIPPPPGPGFAQANYPYQEQFYSPTDFGTTYTPTSQPAFRGLDFGWHSPAPTLPTQLPQALSFGFDRLLASQFDKLNLVLSNKAIIDFNAVDIGNPNPWTQYQTMVSFRTMMASTLLLSNVVSFHVQVMDQANPSTGFQDIGTIPPPPGTALLPGNFIPVNTAQPNLSVGATYDTANLNSSGPGISTIRSLQAIRVTLRVWDPRSQQARQATLIQDF